MNTLISGLLLLILSFFLSRPISLGENSIPPLFSFFSPFSGFWQNAESLKKLEIKVKNNSISKSVKVIYDDRHVPHIFAKNLEDLFFAQGYVIAKERLWQMDISIRSVAGTLSEIVGERALEADKKARNMGLPWAAERTLEAWKVDPEGMKYLDAFVNGVNTYIQNLKPKEYPLEFKLLNYKPEEWTAYKTALFVKGMCRTLNSRNGDLANTNALEFLGKEAYDLLYPDYNKKQSPIIQEKHWDEVASLNQHKDDFKLFGFHETEKLDFDPYMIGSNNWAVSGEKSENGSPILCNDPHLGLTLPSIWFETHLVAPDLNVYGVSLVGMPGVALGFNEQIAWGQTNTGFDVFDYYKIEWKDKKNGIYILDGKEIKADVRIEEYLVNGGKTILDTVLYTVWGPVLKEANGKEDLGQKWLSHAKGDPREISTYIRINLAKNHSEFEQAIQSYYAPANNFVFASVDGDIAMRVVGKMPIYEDGVGKTIQEGNTIANDWEGFIPFEEMPHEINPERQYVSSANQHPTDPSYPYYYNAGFEDYRSRYINRILDQKEKLNVQDMMHLQFDAGSLRAEELLPILLSYLDRADLNEKEKETLKFMESWNYQFIKDSKGATAYDIWSESFYEKSFDEIFTIQDSVSIRFPEFFRLIELAEEEPESKWFDYQETQEIEELADIVNLSFKAASFDSIEIKTWSEHRDSYVPHLGRISAFNSKRINTDGAQGTPNSLGRSFGPSWRMVVELGDPIKAYGVYPGGQSGNPGSPNFSNFIDNWANGEYYLLNNSTEEANINGSSTLLFTKQ